MAVNARWRYNPFTGVSNSILITDEQHTIEFFTEQNAYGFFANEGVELAAGNPVSLVEDVSALTAFTEIPKTIAPNAGQFRVDYDATGYYNTGFVNCNASDVGKNVLFTYYGTGTIVHPSFRLNSDFNLPGNLSVEGVSTLQGDVNLATLSGSEISASNKIIQDVADPVALTDAMNRRALLQGLPFRNYEELTTSGTWTRPANVDKVFVECVGGGGGGAGGLTGNGNAVGGGGSSGATARDLITVSGDVSYTIGAGGAGGAIDAAGSSGEATTFGTVSASGGNGGATTTNGGSGGAAPDLSAFPGGNGVRDSTQTISGCGGGPGGGRSTNATLSNTGVAGAANSGGGGSGGVGSANPNSAGGAGGSGIIRLWY